MKIFDWIKNLVAKEEAPEFIDYPKDDTWMFNKEGVLIKEAFMHCKEFYDLAKTKQSKEWHKEGDALTHTFLVYDAMCDILKNKPTYGIFSVHDSHILKLAALCHDLGKAPTTYWSEEEKTWKCKNHGKEGEKIARRLLYNMNVNDREEVCWLVRYHMEFHHILEKPIEKRIALMSKLSHGVSTIHKLLVLNLADTMGSISKEPANPDDKFMKIRAIVDYLGYYDETSVEKKTEVHDVYTAYIMIGVPGSGKDTYIKEHLSEAFCICRDDIREEITDGNIIGRKLMLDKDGEKKVTKIVNERIKQCCEEKKDFVINQTSLNLKTRKSICDEIKKHGNPKIVYVMVEAPDLDICVQRRGEMKWENIINRMMDNYEFPLADEYDELIILKQHYNG